MNTEQNFPVIKALLFGVILMVSAVIATIAAGFVVGFNASADSTVKVMASMFMYPTPYLLYVVIGGAVFHTKRWKPIAITFNLGAVVLVAIWVLNIFVFVHRATETTSILEEAISDNFVWASLTALSLIVIMIVEGQVAWPQAQPKED